LLLDEPLSALDAQIRLELRGEIRRIQQQLGITTIYVTHDQEEALSLSDRLVVMNAGHVEQMGSPFEIYNRPATPFVARFVGAVNRLTCHIVDAGRGILRCGDQMVTASGPLHPNNGQLVTLMVRPEEVRLGEDGGENHLTGWVESVTFRGSLVRIQLKLDEGDLALDLLNERQLVLPGIGQPQVVSFAARAAWVMIEAGE
jgi:putative spermidine/putrescine transport system ATP-binding protein